MTKIAQTEKVCNEEWRGIHHPLVIRLSRTRQRHKPPNAGLQQKSYCTPSNHASPPSPIPVNQSAEQRAHGPPTAKNDSSTTDRLPLSNFNEMLDVLILHVFFFTLDLPQRGTGHGTTRLARLVRHHVRLEFSQGSADGAPHLTA